MKSGTTRSSVLQRVKFLVIGGIASAAFLIQLRLQAHLGHGPTVLAVWGRIPFAVLTVLAALAAIWPDSLARRYAEAGMVTLLLIAIGLSAWQAAIGRHWLEPPAFCSGAASAAELRASLDSSRVPQCDGPQGRIHGLPISAWTGLAGLGLLALYAFPLTLQRRPSAIKDGAGVGRALVSGLLVVAMVAWVAVARTGVAAGLDLPPITPEDRTMGAATAPLVMVEYVSLTCPHCAEWATKVFPSLREQWIVYGRLRFVLRDFPLDGKALDAAQLARCVPADRYFAVIGKMLAAQADWIGSVDSASKLAALAGLDGAQAEKCRADTRLTNAILNSRLLAERAGLTGVPALVVNGSRIPAGPYFDPLDAALRQLGGER